MAELIRGKVAQIISERSLAINRGSQHGVTEGMEFVVLGPAAEIIDPDTSEHLGGIERHKVKVRATTVAAKFSICSTFSPSNVGFLTAANVFSEPKPAPTLKSKDSDYVAPLSPEESFVEVGDEVRQVE